jgi:D-alanyl-D-alanine carboxypeptidase
MSVTAVALTLLLAGATQAELDGEASDLIAATGSPGGVVMRDCGDGAQIGVAGVRVRGSEVAILPSDLWHLGSNTKAMTATLAARLVEQGVVGWDMTVAEALGAYDLEIHPALGEATLEELLGHRSGMVSNSGRITALRLMGADADRDLEADRLVYARDVLGEPAGPRGEFLYSNAGYVIAGLMLEARAGLPYEALMEREVFEPLGLDSPGWGPPGEAGEIDQPRGHRLGFFGGLGAREPGAGADNPPALNAAGRAHMSFADLARFLQAHIHRDEAYLDAHSWTRLHTPTDGDNYALGWGVRPSGVLAHSGSNTFWFVQMAADPSSGCAVAVGVNDGRIDDVRGPVTDMTGALLSPQP